MAKTRNNTDIETASLISLDGRLQLAAGVICQSVADLSDTDIVKALDSLCWWLDPTGGVLWLDCLGDQFPSDIDRVFWLVIGGRRHAKKYRIGRPAVLAS